MRGNTLNERRKALKAQDKAVSDRDRSYDHGNRAQNRTPATSNGIRQVVSLDALPVIDKTITVQEGEICVTWRLAVEDVRALQMLLLTHEAKGWKVNRD